MNVAPYFFIWEILNARIDTVYGIIFREKTNKEVFMVKVVGVVINMIKYDENNFVVLEVDDGTGVIPIKVISNKEKIADEINQIQVGDYVLIIGRVKIWKKERYILPIKICKLVFEEAIFQRFLRVLEYVSISE